MENKSFLPNVYCCFNKVNVITSTFCTFICHVLVHHWLMLLLILLFLYEIHILPMYFIPCALATNTRNMTFTPLLTEAYICLMFNL